MVDDSHLSALNLTDPGQGPVEVTVEAMLTTDHDEDGEPDVLFASVRCDWASDDGFSAEDVLYQIVPNIDHLGDSTLHPVLLEMHWDPNNDLCTPDEPMLTLHSHDRISGHRASDLMEDPFMASDAAKSNESWLLIPVELREMISAEIDAEAWRRWVE